MDAIILNKNFEKIAVVDYYTEFINKRNLYGEGEIELSIPASYEALSNLSINNYITRLDDEMIGVIKYVEVQDSPADGKICKVTAQDITKNFLNKRVVWGDIMFSGSLVDLVKKLIYENFGLNCQVEARRILTADGKNFIRFDPTKDASDEEGLYCVENIVYKSDHEKIGDYITETLQTYGYGCKLVWETDHLRFKIIKGADRSSYISFTGAYHNVVSTNFTSDYSSPANTSLVGGEIIDNGNGSSTRRYQAVGPITTGIDREEIFVDASEMTSSIDWQELLKSYPPYKKVGDIPANTTIGGYIEEMPLGEITYYKYVMKLFRIPIQDKSQFEVLKVTYYEYHWYLEEKNRISYFCVSNVPIALLARDIFKEPPQKQEDGTYEQIECRVLDTLYMAMMMSKGFAELSNYTDECSFSAEIDPGVLYSYKKDYFLGDKVLIKNAFGISRVAQIIEVTETWDTSGYHLDVSIDDRTSKSQEIIYFLMSDTMSYTQEGKRIGSLYLATEDGSYIIV